MGSTNLVPEKHESLTEFELFDTIRFHERHTYYVQTGENPTTARILLTANRSTATPDLFRHTCACHIMFNSICVCSAARLPLCKNDDGLVVLGLTVLKLRFGVDRTLYTYFAPKYSTGLKKNHDRTLTAFLL